jgi:hypothetical protein
LPVLPFGFSASGFHQRQVLLPPGFELVHKGRLPHDDAGVIGDVFSDGAFVFQCFGKVCVHRIRRIRRLG